MTRPLRIEYGGALYHVTARGNAREAIYKDDENRKVGNGVRPYILHQCIVIKKNK